MKRPSWPYTLSGACAGIVAGLFGAGGGSILIPMLNLTAKPEEEELFFRALEESEQEEDLG